MHSFRVRAPGRVCLFGEHSDYLGLPVIPAALDMAIEIDASPRKDSRIIVDYPDVEDSDIFSSEKETDYRHSRDYLRSAFNLLFRRGMKPKDGWNLRVTGNIPISAGLSSSSALTVAAVMAFARMAGTELEVTDLAQTAFQAEVTEFGESGGMMDHFSSAFGYIIHVDPGLKYKTTCLPAQIEGLAIGDSLEKKEDTVGDLKRIRSEVEREYKILATEIPRFDQRTTSSDKVFEVSPEEPTESRKMAQATLQNRDLTEQAFGLLKEKNPNPKRVGELLDVHHNLLRSRLKRSTRKIEDMIEAAKSAGALGCKINGSGGGGTMLALAPGNEKQVAEAIRSVGGVPYRVEIGPGARSEGI
ncbi:MAG: galactokinase family protein [Candidatus Thorarchaeota archaeon]